MKKLGYKLIGDDCTGKFCNLFFGTREANSIIEADATLLGFYNGEEPVSYTEGYLVSWRESKRVNIEYIDGYKESVWSDIISNFKEKYGAPEYDEGGEAQNLGGKIIYTYSMAWKFRNDYLITLDERRIENKDGRVIEYYFSYGCHIGKLVFPELFAQL